MKSPVPIAAPMSGAEIEALAQKIINRYQPEIVGRVKTFDIERFFELDLESLTGVRTDYRELPYGIHGFTDIDAREVVIDLKLNRTRQDWYGTGSVSDLSIDQQAC